MRASDSSSVGTGIESPSTVTMPSLVPKEMVEMGTPWSLAARAAVNAPRGDSRSGGTVSLPSDSSTMRAGGGPSPPPITAPVVAIACRAVKMPSPVAVRGSGTSLSMARFTCSWSVVGATNRVAPEENLTSPRLIPPVSMSAKCLPACRAASIRLGATSVAAIDSETSMTSMTTARLRGPRTSWVGPAMAVVSRASAATSRAAGRCRHRRGLRPAATCSNSAVLAKRSTRRARARWMTM